MTLAQIKDRFYGKLKHLYPETEIASFFDLLAEHHFGIKRIDLALRPELKTQSWEAEPFDKALAELLDERPIQYILGETEFAGLRFFVNESVLIPRPETEELVLWVIEKARGLPAVKILDIGTGSGCIPIAISKSLPEAEIHGLDVCEKALEIARNNADRLQARVKFFKTDILSCSDLGDTYDIIVSNPPYVRIKEKDKMRGNVLKHEPELALFVTDEDPLQFYRIIAELGTRSLNPEGMLFFEINEQFAEATRMLLSEMSYTNIEVKRDIYGKERMIRAHKK